MKKLKKLESTMQAYLFLLPAIIFLCFFLYRSVLTTIVFSFINFVNFRPGRYVGFANYVNMFKDIQFKNGIILTFEWAIMNALIPTFVGLMLALLMEFFTRRRWFTNISRTILFLPQMLSLVSVGLLWSLIYDPNVGPITDFLKALGFSTKFVAYSNQSTALFIAFIPVIWREAGFSMVVFSAALQGVSTDLIESSLIEGARKIDQIIYIMLPCIVKTITMMVSINLILGFKAFELLYVMTSGGPGMATKVVSIYAYQQGFDALRFDYSSVMITFILICVIVLNVFFNGITRRIEEKVGD